MYLFSVVLTESVMTDWAIVELLGDARTISKETGSVSTEVQEMVLLPLKSSLAPCWGSVIVMAAAFSVLAGRRRFSCSRRCGRDIPDAAANRPARGIRGLENIFRFRTGGINAAHSQEKRTNSMTSLKDEDEVGNILSRFSVQTGTAWHLSL